MTTPPSVLEELIGSYLAGKLTLPEFWKQFTFTWADSGASACSSSDEAFFAEVADRLHYVDFTSPSEPFLDEPHAFREWLGSTVARREGT